MVGEVDIGMWAEKGQRRKGMKRPTREWKYEERNLAGRKLCQGIEKREKSLIFILGGELNWKEILGVF